MPCYGLIQYLCGNTIKLCQIPVQHDLLATNHKDSLLDLFRYNRDRLLGH